MIPTKPITRIEKYLAGIVKDTTLPNPITRIEQYLAKISGEDVGVPDKPITRIEMYLAKIAGEDVEIPDKPILRIEMYLAAIAGEDVTVPEPITREEQYLYEWANTPKAEVVTVTGISPLVLAAAYGSPLRSLTQYGKCEQASTPTPAAPVDIVCNNGTLKMVDDELPIGYKRLTGIRFDGDTWYETGEALTGADDVTMTLDNTASQGQNVFGSYNGTSASARNFSLFIYGNGSTSNSYFRYGEQLLRPRYGTGERTITFGKSGTDGFTVDVTATPDTFETPANAYIGMLPNSTSPPYTGDIKGNIIVGTRLKWIPSERVSDNAIGYYEAVKGVFIEPSGTGTPTSLGYDGTHYTLAVVGTPEMLSVTASGADTQTATAPDLFAVGAYADEVEIISGAVKHKVGITILTGEETGWALSDSGTTHRFRGMKPSDCHTPASRAPIMSSHFVYNATGQGTGGAFIGASQYWYFIPTDQTIDTADKWRDWLKGQYAAGTPVVVIYPLAEETTESVAPQQLETNDGDNIITVTANVDNIQLEATYERKVA